METVNKKSGVFKTGISFRIIVFVILALVLGVGITAYFTYKIAFSALYNSKIDQLRASCFDVASLFEEKIENQFKKLETIASLPFMKTEEGDWIEKLQFLDEDLKNNKDSGYLRYTMVTHSGIQHYANGKKRQLDTQMWYREAIAGRRYTKEPKLSPQDNLFTISYSVPLTDMNGNNLGGLLARVKGEQLSNILTNISFAENSDCYVLGTTGNVIASRDLDLVYSAFNAQEETKKQQAFKELAAMEKSAMDESSNVHEYAYNGKKYVAVSAKIKNFNWTIISVMPKGTIVAGLGRNFNKILIFVVAVLIFCALIVSRLLSRILSPIKNTTEALKNISEGDGDLTARLTVEGNDEIANMSSYFNKTIAKIAESVRSIGDNTHTMQEIGMELSSNMSETASSVNQISANIEGVKQQTLTQAASITETSAAMEQIIRTIKNVNGSIETQATSVARSSSSIEEMVANIISITQTLNKADAAVQHLANATDDGKNAVSGARELTQKIAEESGSLIEASNVIQNIAGQTNLLAMNAAIEAAHAGDAGRGFAVVADEIRKLAEESSVQGKTITGTLKSLSAEIQEVANSAQLVGEKFNIIFELSEEVKKTSSVLMQAMQEQENGSREVLAAIKSINTVTMEVKDGSAEMLKGGEQVAGEMRKLDDLTRVITESMNEMASGTVQINNAVQDVNQITQKNKEAIESLVTEVEKFKV